MKKNLLSVKFDTPTGRMKMRLYEDNTYFYVATYIKWFLFWEKFKVEGYPTQIVASKLAYTMFHRYKQYGTHAITFRGL